MTTPTTTQQNNHTDEIIAAAALSLALLALEKQTRDNTQQTVQNAATIIAAAAVAAAATGPLTGIALVSLVTFHTILTRTLNQARDELASIIDSSYQAATQLTLNQLRTQLGTTNTPTTLPELSTTLNTLTRDITTMIGHTQTDIHNRIQNAYDTNDTPSTRILAVKQATDKATTTFANRADKTASTTVHRAATDAQQAVYNHYQLHTGTPGLMKRWHTTSTNPCGMCQALDGTLIGINGDFDPRATTNDKDLRSAWRDLSGPPRHPNCRCRLELVRT